jgi:hypothetical protein
MPVGQIDGFLQVGCGRVPDKKQNRNHEADSKSMQPMATFEQLRLGSLPYYFEQCYRAIP